MASNVFLQYEENVSGTTSLQHGQNIQVTKLQDDLRDRVSSLKQDFIQFLRPSDVIFDIQGLDDDFIDTIIETESYDRKTSVKVLMKKILQDSGLVTQFVFVLDTQGYKRFIDPIHRTFPDKGTTFCQEYFEFIIKRLKGELIDVLDALTICGNLYQNGCIKLRDKEDIEAVHSRSGRTAANQRLFQIVARRKANWALLFAEAMKESQEYVKCKMDPSSNNEDLERTGIVVDHGKTYDSEPSHDITRWTYVSGKKKLRYSQRKRLEPIEKRARNTFVMKCLITNLFACHCVIMANQIVFCGRNVFLIYDLDGNFIREISMTTCDWIYGMAVLSDELVAVTYDDCSLIDIININTGEVTERIKTIDSCSKISYENGLMYAIFKDNTIKVMNMSGKIIRSFPSPSLYINYIKIDKDRLFLTDYNDDILYCYDVQGQFKWKFPGKGIKEMHGVTTDRQGNVYIAGAFSNNIIVLENTGKHFKELVNKTDKVFQPIVIFYDKSNDCLLVCNAKGSVSLFDIIHPQTCEIVKPTSSLLCGMGLVYCSGSYIDL